MAAPTYSWNSISSTQTDPESPIDTTLMEGIRQNLIHLREWLGSGFTPAIGHDHDGLNSKNVALADGTVTIAKLKLMRGSLTQASSGVTFINIDRYAHLPEASLTQGGLGSDFTLDSSSIGNQNGSYRQLKLTFNSPSGGSVTVYWDYHTN